MTKNQDYEDDTSRQFDDEDYEGVFFVINDILYNLQDKAGIPASWKLLDRHCGSFLQPEDAIQHSWHKEALDSALQCRYFICD